MSSEFKQPVIQRFLSPDEDDIKLISDDDYDDIPETSKKQLQFYKELVDELLTVLQKNDIPIKEYLERLQQHNPNIYNSKIVSMQFSKIEYLTKQIHERKLSNNQISEELNSYINPENEYSRNRFYYDDILKRNAIEILNGKHIALLEVRLHNI